MRTAPVEGCGERSWAPLAAVVGTDAPPRSGRIRATAHCVSRSLDRPGGTRARRTRSAQAVTDSTSSPYQTSGVLGAEPPASDGSAVADEWVTSARPPRTIG